MGTDKFWGNGVNTGVKAAVDSGKVAVVGHPPKAAVAFTVSSTGVVSVSPLDLLQTEAARSQIEALKHLRATTSGSGSASLADVAKDLGTTLETPPR